MAIITRANFTARGKLQNIVLQTYHNGKIVMRSKPLRYRKSTNQASVFNRTTMQTALTITSNWYISFGQYYFNPPPQYERSQASFLGLLRKYAVQIGQQNSYYDPIFLSESNMSFCNALTGKKLSCNILGFGGIWNAGNLNFNFQFLSPTNPNDNDNDIFYLGYICTNHAEPMKSLQPYDTRNQGSAIGTLIIENYAIEKDYVIFGGYSRADGTETRNGYFSNFFGYFAVKNNVLYNVTQRIYLQGIPF